MSNVLGLLFMVLFMMFTSTKTQENDKEDCGQYNDCSSCITKHQCQYVIWESEMKNISDVKLCVDITLPELEVRKLGPLGNIDDDTHWEMKSFHNETKCHLHHAKKAHSLISKVAQGKLYVFVVSLTNLFLISLLFILFKTDCTQILF